MAGKKEHSSNTTIDSTKNAGEAVPANAIKRKHLTYDQRIARAMDINVKMRDNAAERMTERAQALAKAQTEHREAINEFEKLDRIVKAQEAAIAPTPPALVPEVPQDQVSA